MGKLLPIIDDDPVERAILERLLLGAGYRVMTAADRFWAGEVGADALLTKPADVPLLLQTIADPTARA